MAGLLCHLKRCGFAPATIVDVGAYHGEWSRMAGGIFPESRMVLFEANSENEEKLRQATRLLGPRSRYHLSLLGPEGVKELTLYRMASGTSVLAELTTIERTAVTLPVRTLDSHFDTPPASPVLMKLDVQGFELSVLSGAPKLLENAEVLILETSLLPYNAGAPLFGEVIRTMEGKGFLVYDFCGQFRRQTDDTLFQVDVVLVRQSSSLREPKKFWLNEP